MSDGTGEHLQLMRPDGSDLHMPDESWRTRFSINCCADWSPDGTRLAMHVDGTATALVRLDPATGMALETRVVDLPGADDEYHRWSPDGQLLAYEAVTDGSWDLWLVDSDGTHPRRLTNLPGNERQAAWRPGSEFLYFEMDRGAIWRVPLDASDARLPRHVRGWSRPAASRWMPTRSISLAPAIAYSSHCSSARAISGW